jgi:hypothetical protein
VSDSDEVLTWAEAAMATRETSSPTTPSEASPKLRRRISVLACSAWALAKRNVVMPACGASSQRVKRANEGTIFNVSRSLPSLVSRTRNCQPMSGCACAVTRVRVQCVALAGWLGRATHVEFHRHEEMLRENLSNDGVTVNE